MAKPVVIVVENPDEDPDVYVAGDVELIQLSSYPMSNWCQEEEVPCYGEEYLAKLVDARDRFPEASPSWVGLDMLVQGFRARLAAAVAERPQE